MVSLSKACKLNMEGKKYTMIFSCIIFFIFNYYTFNYISKILIDFKKDKLYYINLSILNTILMVIVYSFMLPYWLTYLIVIITLTLEFSEARKERVPQAFLYSGILVINISSAHVFFTSICCCIFKVIPYDLFYTPNLYFANTAILFISLFIVFKICSKIISPEDIKKVSNTSKYCGIFSIITIAILIYTVLDISMLNSKAFDFKFMPTFIFTPIYTLLVFYILFFYTINTIKMDGVRQRTNELEFIRRMNILNKQKIENKIIKEELTGCYNRKYIFSKLQNMYEENIYNFGIFFIDINKLKFVNDTLGHKYGDEYILNVSEVIKESVKEQDLVAKIGGDEFLVIVNDVTENDLIKIENDIKQNMEKLNEQTEKYEASASLGYIFVDENMLKLGVDEIIKLADEKMRLNKKYFKGEKT